MSTYDLMAQELREQRALVIQVIERQNELAESLSQQLQDARGELHEAGKIIASLQEGLEKASGKNERLQAALEGIGWFAQMMVETQHQMHPAHLRLVAMIADAARIRLAGESDND